MTENLPPLGNKTWKEFIFEDIFKIRRGESLYKQYMKRGNIPYVSASALNNGISDYTAIANRNSNMISLAYDGSIGASFYQNTQWFASEKIVSIELKHYKLNRYIALFLCKLINNQKIKYGYAYKWSVGLRMNRGKILLPIDENSEPDYLFMENYMRQIEEKLLNLYKNYIDRQLQNNFVIPEDKKVWKEFYIEEIAEIISGRDIYDAERFSGKNPYIGASSNNNGICHFVGNENETLEKNCISVNRNGSVGYAFYHQYAALYSNDCRKIRPNVQNKYSSIFISQQITLQREKYGYGYKMGTERLRKQKILLPVDDNGEPDWEYMKKYMREKENSLLKKYFEKNF